MFENEPFRLRFRCLTVLFHTELKIAPPVTMCAYRPQRHGVAA
jgi:hypothetical protein